MKSGVWLSCLALGLALGYSCSLLQAQDSLRGPDGGTSYQVSGVELLAIPGKPFSARTTTDWTRTLQDGTTVKLRLTASLARDSEGRMYRERRTFVPADSTAESRLKDILLFDPAAATETTCAIARRHCVVTSHRPRTRFATALVGASPDGTRYLAREELGADTMNALNVIGTRETLTINAGAVGNEQALVSTREFWYSPALETNLAVTRKDPREGLQVVRLSSVSRSEPEALLFAVPAGFSVEDARPRR